LPEQLARQAKKVRPGPIHTSPNGRGSCSGRRRGKIGYQGGKVDLVRPRLRGSDLGDDVATMNLVLIGVARRKIGRAVRPPQRPLRHVDGDGMSKSAASRRCVALPQQRLGDCSPATSPSSISSSVRSMVCTWPRTSCLIGVIGIGEKAHSQAGRGLHRERRGGPCLARQPRRARVRSEATASPHSRWSEGAVEGGARHIRSPNADPALLGGAQSTCQRPRAPELARGTTTLPAIVPRCRGRADVALCNVVDNRSWVSLRRRTIPAAT
jgi:hypothetical protein